MNEIKCQNGLLAVQHDDPGVWQAEYVARGHEGETVGKVDYNLIKKT